MFLSLFSVTLCISCATYPTKYLNIHHFLFLVLMIVSTNNCITYLYEPHVIIYMYDLGENVKIKLM